MKTRKSTRSTSAKRGRKTVALAPTLAPTPVPPMITLADVIALLGMNKVAQPVQPATPIATPIPTPSVRTRTVYQIVKNPIPPFGETAMAVWKFLQTHSPATQEQIEQGCQLTEGQVKGAFRQLRLAGYTTATKLES